MAAGIPRALTQGARSLARTPQFTVAAVVTLALALGTNTAVFSVVQGVLLKPLPYEEPERLVQLRHTAPGLGYDDFGVSPGLYWLYSESEAFSASGIYMPATVNVTGGDGPPVRESAALMSHGVLGTLGVTPLRGRAFDESEDAPDGPAVVVLSHGLWQDRFGGVADVVGRTLDVDGQPRTVVGVMPETFAFPTANTRLWLPLALAPTGDDYGAFTYEAVGRLAGHVDAEAASSRLGPVLQHLRDSPEGSGGELSAFIDAGRMAPRVVPLKETVVGDAGAALWILLGTVGFVFLIASANVTNLFLVRSEARQGEMAMRAALGARRTGLIGHFAVEALLIAAAGGMFGVMLAWWALRSLLALAPPGIPRLHEISIDPVVLGFALLATLLSAVLLGLLPALRLTSPALLTTLSRSSRGATTGRERHRTRQVLVVAQTALALVLLVGSGLMVRSFQQMRAIDAGFQPENVATFRLSLPTPAYDQDAVARFHRDLLPRLRALPGVLYAGATTSPPLADCCAGTAHFIEDQPVAPGEMPPMFAFSTVSDNYFETMRIPVLAGRSFAAQDGDGARPVIVSQALAERIWPGTDAVGRRLRPASTDTGWHTVVGVVGSVRDRGLQNDPTAMVYYPLPAGETEFLAGNPAGMTYVLRTDRPDDILGLARAEVWSIDPNLPVAAGSTYARIVADSMIRLRFTMLALVAASLIALLLGAIGLYSVISYIVAQRTGEIGIRMALGAQPGEVRRMVVLQGGRLIALGLLAGLAGALALTRLMHGLLYGTEPTDPATFAIVTTTLAIIALVATYLPARRASRIDPAASLRGG